MRDQELVNALREHAEWAEGNQYETPITLCDDLAEAADRLENQNAHIAALQQEIEKLRRDLKLHRCATCDFWRENDPRCMNGQSQWGGKAVSKDNYCRYWEHHSDWIPVTERLPDHDELVLVIASGKPKENITLDEAVELATLYSDGWCLETWPEWTGANVTYWIPLPGPPEEER